MLRTVLRERERGERERERFELGTVDMLSIGGMTFVLGVLCVACLVIISGLPSKIHRTRALAILAVCTIAYYKQNSCGLCHREACVFQHPRWRNW